MKTGKKIAVLSAVFLIAAVVYFMWPMGKTEEGGEQITYTAMEEATLPIVYPKMRCDAGSDAGKPRGKGCYG